MSQSLAGASKFIIGVFVLLASASCSDNILEELSNKTNEAALLESVKRSLATQDFAAAVTTCALFTTAQRLDPDTAYTCASAYAGRAGLNVLNLVTDVAGYSPPNNLLVYLMGLNNGAVAQDITDLVTARDLLRALGQASARTAEQNALMTMIAIHSLGIVANLYADGDDNGTVDGGYNSCDITDLPAAGAQMAVNALWELQESGGASGIPGSSTLVTAVQAACTALAGFSGVLDFCAQTDPSAFTTDQVRGARSLFAENALDFGLGDCANGPTCVCP